MKKFGRLNGRKAERGKRAKQSGTGRINEMHGSRKELQNLATSKWNAPKSRHIWRKFTLRREFAPLNFTWILERS